VVTSRATNLDTAEGLAWLSDGVTKSAKADDLRDSATGSAKSIPFFRLFFSLAWQGNATAMDIGNKARRHYDYDE